MVAGLTPDSFPPEWASEWGENGCWLWIAFIYQGIRHGFRWIQPGEFKMGSPNSEEDREDMEMYGNGARIGMVIIPERWSPILPVLVRAMTALCTAAARAAATD